MCGDHTWNALVEAGWRLGDRPLYLTLPMLRGDDVASLQRRLGELGFDAGRVDGVFGPDTERALVDFQRNAGLVVDAIFGQAALLGLNRLGGRGDANEPVAMVRERERLRQGPRSLDGRTVVIGESGGGAAFAFALRKAIAATGAHAQVVSHPDASEQAAQANAVGADAFVGIMIQPEPGCTVAYYKRPDWESWAGRRLASILGEELPAGLGVEAAVVRGMTLPLLRETRMPAVLCEIGPVGAVVEHGSALAGVVAAALRRWVVDANID